MAETVTVNATCNKGTVWNVPSNVASYSPTSGGDFPTCGVTSDPLYVWGFDMNWPSLAADAVIESATLYVWGNGTGLPTYADAGNAVDIGVHKINVSWSEGQPNFPNSYSSITSIPTGTASGATWFTVNVTSLVQAKYAGTDFYGFYIGWNDLRDNYVYFTGYGGANAPYVEIKYHIPTKNQLMMV